MSKKHDAILLELRRFGLAYPGTGIKRPWPGHHSASFADHEPDIEMLKAWLHESYRAQAPKKLVASLGAAPAAPAAAKKRTKR